jgi:tRNA(adenine34) deaminase
VGDAEERWGALDDAWRQAFAMAWEAVGTGNIGVGAAVSDEHGTVLVRARNRVSESDGPAGQISGSSLAHAEINALAGLPFRSPRSLVLTTTLQPCLQCAAAIRMGPIALVRIAGEDPLWHGCDDFGSLNDWVGRRGPVPSEGPRGDEIGVFATLLARLGPGLVPHVEEELRRRGESPIIDLARTLEDDGSLKQLVECSVDQAFTYLWPTSSPPHQSAGHR